MLMLALRRSRATAGERRSAKGGTRTPIPFREPDPKSGASASSATFANPHTSRGWGAEGRGTTAGGRPVYAVLRVCRGGAAALAIRNLGVDCATFEMMSSLTHPRDVARELMARLAATGVTFSPARLASASV